jgi:hypothetical protein
MAACPVRRGRRRRRRGEKLLLLRGASKVFRQLGGGVISPPPPPPPLFSGEPIAVTLCRPSSRLASASTSSFIVFTKHSVLAIERKEPGR